jgi:predicted TIM-barrel fold metal-dependent hydrolase
MSRTLTKDNIGPVFDADNHYWETAEAFMRYRDPKYKDSALRLVEHEGQVRYFMGDELFQMLPGPGDKHLRPVPGSLFDFFGGRAPGSSTAGSFSQPPEEHPEYFNRDDRLKTMDEQGLEAAWMFPSHGVCIEGPMQSKDVPASLNILTAFNRWINDEWGFAYKNRIFGIPMLSLTDLDLALSELEWVLERGARVVTMRHGPALTPDGYRSPADPMFDPFWARVQEAGITVAIHAGQEESYKALYEAKARAWGLNYDMKRKFDPTGRAPAFSFESHSYSPQLMMMLQKNQLVHDHAAVIIAHGLFERFPRLRIAYIEFGGTWVGPLLDGLQMVHNQHPGMFGKNPVDQFHENCWVAPFVEGNVSELAKHIPTERILFGSDWPHGEGVEKPRDFIGNLDDFSDEDVRKIMVENARELTYA